MNHLLDEEKDELFVMYRSGCYSIKEMSEYFGVSRYIIEREIRKWIA